MTADIITDLSHSKDLVVIARNSTEPYNGKPIDIRQIGSDLNVKYVVEGSIQSMGDQIRVNAQLIEAASGSYVWSERYDRPVDDLFAVQNDVTQRIAATVLAPTGPSRKPSAVFSSASRPRAYLPSTPTCWALRLKTRRPRKACSKQKACFAKLSNSIRNWHALTSAWSMSNPI